VYVQSIDPGDFLIHHAIALGLHVTTLICVKGAVGYILTYAAFLLSSTASRFP
jgi:hypothetical protein